MGNEHPSGTSHHFIMEIPTNKSKERRNPPRWIKQVPTPRSRPSWQIARDISMHTLSKKSPILSSNQGTLPFIISPRFVSRQHTPDETSTIRESFKIFKVPRMPTEKEAAQVAISSEDLCSFCHDSCIGDYVRCRVCTKTCHSKCLFQRGYIRNQSFSLPRLAKQDWSCPECNDLTRLLNQDELHYLIHVFEQIDRDNDGYIILEEFLSLKSNKNISDRFLQYNSDSERKLFSLMDSTQKGVIAWSDFIMFYSCKLTALKDKTELTTKLTNKELVLARKIFLQDPRKIVDNDFNIIITREYFTQIYKNFTQTLKKKYGIGFIDVILNEDYHSNDLSKRFSVMDWSDYLRELALVILLNRCNDDIISNQLPRGSIPPHLLKATIVSRSRFPSIDIDAPSRSTFSGSFTPAAAAATLSCDGLFRKHAKILEKLNQKNRDEALKKRQMVNFTIVESLDEEENINLPKLKINARDDRKAIVDPWTAVKEIEQLRNQPIFVRTTRLKIPIHP